MKRINLIPEILIASFFLTVLVTSCQKEDQSYAFPEGKSQMRLASNCGDPISYDLVKQKRTDILGSVQISNDRSNVYVTVTAPAGLSAIKLYYGDCENIPINPAHYGNEKILAGQNSYTYTIPKEEVDSCGCYAARVETNGVGLMSAEYCLQPCCMILPGDYKTYGQGGYGSEARGSNPGNYLATNFNAAFPDGIEIGCNYTLRFETPEAIKKFLPQGSTPASLSGNFTNPDNSMNVLAGQVLTLALNIGFDNYDPDFGASSDNLKNLVVSSGTFEGWTVAQVFNESNNILGGCLSSYTPSQINEMVTAINENFEDGEIVGEILTCP